MGRAGARHRVELCSVKPLDVEKQLLEGEGSAPLHCTALQTAAVSTLDLSTFEEDF